MRGAWLIARSVLVEAVRRREVYAVVLVSLVLIGAVMTVDFFNIEGLSKFYREVALKIMSVATAFTVIVLAARQLPREFESRTIYPLLAKPVSRTSFLAGKLLGVMLAAAFCFLLFMGIFLVGSAYLHLKTQWALFGQYVYLQMLQMLVLATLAFWLSMVMNLDAAITLSCVFYVTSSVILSASTYIYDLVPQYAKALLLGAIYLLPQLDLFDLSEKAVHAEVWPPLPASVMGALTLYGIAFASVYFLISLRLFARKPL
ncbi:MAG: ABC transporter permease subunit [Candidatus Sumerlaeaceae bacterium]|nr:ABC transporter permease subunit [Candidatus Sumerlaeaceae bacterium]